MVQEEEQSLIEANAGLIAGIVNGFAISIIDMIYLRVAEVSVQMENYKTYDRYEQSFVFKLFTFKFINTNMPLFYLGFIEKEFGALYMHLVGMTIQKSLTLLISKFGVKFVKTWIFKKLYFRTVSKKIAQQ